MSGGELAREVIFLARHRQIETPPHLHMNKGPEYWAGWAIAYYQWYRESAFRAIQQAVPFTEIMAMYHPYHEMDISQFVNAVDLRMTGSDPSSRLRRLRKSAMLTQRELADSSGVPLRTIQQYEQGQKDIRRAAAQTARNLAVALHCNTEDLLL